MNTFGLRHAALNVTDPQISKEFYVRVLKMQVEWEPDADNIYLTSGGQDNLALHRAKMATPSSTHSSGQKLDHIGFALPTPQDVDAWHEWMVSQKVEMVQALKTHRDGAKSFYVKDPDGVIIQMIYHPPISKAQGEIAARSVLDSAQSPH
ncbi:MAG: VOC family protein [Methylotenera sp.]|nr:VOC family protein [Oligoflexia bacterium]